MSATVAASPSHYRYSDKPRTVRKPGGKYAGPIGVSAIPSIPASSSSAGVSSTRSFLFGNALSLRTVYGYSNDDRRRTRRRRRPFFPVMEWQDCTVKMEVDIPASAAYNFYSDRESFPRWMPFISSVKVLEDKPDLSRWSLKYNAFGQDIEYSWIARNMQPIPNQKIHWRSLEGLPNRGVVRFYPKGTSSCLVEEPLRGLEIRCGILRNQLTVSYEVPQLLVPVASALRPVLEGLLRRGLERFATLAEGKSS